MSTSRGGADFRRPTRGRNRIRTISSIFSETAKDVSGSAEQLSTLVSSVIIPATPTRSSMGNYDDDGEIEEAGAFRAAANGALATIIQLFFILSFAPVLLFAIFVVLTIALLTSGTITLALGAITISGTVLALSLFTCVLPLSAISALVLFLVRTIIQLARALVVRLRSLLTERGWGST